MEALTMIVVFVVIPVTVGISIALHFFSLNNYGFELIGLVPIGTSFVCGVLFAAGAYLWSGTGLTANTLVALVFGAVAFVGLGVFVCLRSNILIAIWAAAVLPLLSPVMIALLLFPYARARLAPPPRTRDLAVWDD